MATIAYVVELESKMRLIANMMKDDEIDEHSADLLLARHKELDIELSTIKSSSAYMLDLQDYIDSLQSPVITWSSVNENQAFNKMSLTWATAELNTIKNKEENKGRWSPTLFHCQSCRNGITCFERSMTKMVKSE
jgi:hypothetical protein